MECLYGNSARGTWRDGCFTGAPEGYVKEGSGKRHFSPYGTYWGTWRGGFIYLGLQCTVNEAPPPVRAMCQEPGVRAPLLETLKAKQDVSRKALEMEHLSLYRGFVRGTCRESSYTEDYERHVMEGSGNRALFYRALIRGI